MSSSGGYHIVDEEELTDELDSLSEAEVEIYQSEE
jgi:hypothetical protein